MSGAWDAMLQHEAEQRAYVTDITDVYVLGGGSGFHTTFVAQCDVCPWAGLALKGDGGGSTTPSVSNAEARELAQRSADKHNADRHVTTTK